jgi:hypothetical protein
MKKLLFIVFFLAACNKPSDDKNSPPAAKINGFSLAWCGDKKIKDPTVDEIEVVIDKLASLECKDPFFVFEMEEKPDSYLQGYADKEGFDVEIQINGVENHYQSQKKFNAKEVKSAMQDYVNEKDLINDKSMNFVKQDLN